MERRLIRNKHQFKLNLPTVLVRELGFDKCINISIQKVKTSEGEGIVLLKERKVVVKNG